MPTVGIVCRSVSFADGIGGLERTVSAQALQLLSLGWRVTLFAPSRFVDGNIPSSLDFVDIPWPEPISRPGKPGFGLMYLLWVFKARARILRSKPLDVLLCHGGSVGILLGKNSARALPPSVMNPHGMEEFKDGTYLQLTNRAFTRWLSRRGRYANRVISTDKSLYEEVKKNIQCGQSCIVEIPNGVSVGQLDKLAIDGTNLGSGYTFSIVSVGRLVRNKGYDLLAESLKNLSQRGVIPIGWHWTHFGEGPLESEVRQILDGQFKRSYSLLAGVGDADVQATLRGSNLFVQPSRYEGSSLSTLEAMAHGCTIAATPVGGIPDKIEYGRTGILAEAATSDSIEQAIEIAIKSDAPLGSNARSFVQENFSFESSMNALSQTLKLAVRED